MPAEETNPQPAKKLIEISTSSGWRDGRQAEASGPSENPEPPGDNVLEFANPASKQEQRDNAGDIAARQIELAREIKQNHKLLKERFTNIEHDLLPDLATSNAAAAESIRIRIQQDLLLLDEHRNYSMRDLAAEKTLVGLGRIGSFDQNFFVDMTKRADGLEQELSRERELALARAKIVSIKDYRSWQS